MEKQNNDLQLEEHNPIPTETKPSETHDADPVESGGPPSPNEEQRRYWERDLFYKKLSLFVSSGGFFLVMFGFLANYWQVSINTEQLRLNSAQSEKVAKSIRANVENALVSRVIDLDQVFIRDPELNPYFYNDLPIDKDDPKYGKAVATAFMVLDVFDYVDIQNKHYPEFWDTPEAWAEWMIDVFSTSPILRDTLDKYPSWYSDRLKELRKKGQERLEVKVAQKAKP